MTLSDIMNDKYIYLTTKGRKTGKPHTVELWYATFNEKIYLSHEGGYTDWMRNIKKDSQIKFKIGKNEFTGKAQIVKNKKEFNEGKHTLYFKYKGNASDEVVDDWFSESKIIKVLMGKR